MHLFRVMNMWDERYRTNETVYGQLPNVFWASQMAMLNVGTVCLPCDGEGRNAVWAAQQGWEVTSFDLSPEGMAKTKALAQQRQVTVHTQVADALDIEFDTQFDVVGLVFSHMPADCRALFHHRAWSWVKPGGRLIVEGFHRDQLGLNSGGPKTLDMLYDEGTFVRDVVEVFGDARLIWHARCEQVLDEGPFHQGHAVTLQAVLQKERHA